MDNQTYDKMSMGSLADCTVEDAKAALDEALADLMAKYPSATQITTEIVTEWDCVAYYLNFKRDKTPAELDADKISMKQREAYEKKEYARLKKKFGE